VVHVYQGNSVAILVIVQCNSNLVKEELHVKSWGLLAELVVHSDLTIRQSVSVPKL
jgi:hypothetical protein